MNAGLPNITGSRYVNGLDSEGASGYGCFTSKEIGGNGYLAHNAKTGNVPVLEISAKNSNSTYGASNTVTPKSRKCEFLVKY